MNLHHCYLNCEKSEQIGFSSDIHLLVSFFILLLIFIIHNLSFLGHLPPKPTTMATQAAVHKRNLESAILFMQTEHAQTLKGLHEEIKNLQKKCSGNI